MTTVLLPKPGKRAIVLTKNSEALLLQPTLD